MSKTDEGQILVISMSVYDDWSPGDEPGEVDVHTEDTTTETLGMARSPEEAARLIAAFYSARPGIVDEDSPGPVDAFYVKAVSTGPLSEENGSRWSCEIPAGLAEEEDKCLTLILEAPEKCRVAREKLREFKDGAAMRAKAGG